MAVASGDGAWWLSPEFRRALENFNRLQRPLNPLMPALDAFTRAARVNADLAARINPLATSAAFRQITESMKLYESMKLPAGFVSTMDSIRQAQVALMPQISPALRTSVVDFSKLLPSSLPTVRNSSALVESVGRLAQSLTTTVEQHYDDLVEAVETASAEERASDADTTELTDFQAWILVRVWVASLVFGWAVEDKLRGVSESEREKRGAMYADIRNKVIAAVIVAALGALARIGWDVAGPE